MKFTCLSHQANKCCSVIKFKETLILLDAGLDMSPCLNFLPLPLVPSSHLNSLRDWVPRSFPADNQLENELKECAGRVFVDSSPEFCYPDFSLIDLKDVDVILISNYQSLLSAPYITEMTSFEGVMYATEPTIQIARLFMEEMIHYVERAPRVRSAGNWKRNADLVKSIPFPIGIDPSLIPNMSPLYNSRMLNACLARVKSIGFGERINLFGSLQASAHSSGHSIGSCNWIIRSDHEKIVYLSASSTMTTHPKPMEIPLLQNPDLLILTSMTTAPAHNPDSSLLDLCKCMKSTLVNQGNVLIPCYSSGIIYDLIECLVQTLDQSGLSAVPIYFISPIADQSLAYSNILAEWLTQVKQSRVYLPEEPFPHSAYVRSGRVKHFPSIHSEAFSNEYRTPCVIFTGHPSLRFGEVVHLIELWGSNPANLIAFTDPEFPYVEALAPFQPLGIRVSFTPIDPSLNFASANKLIQELNPRHLLIPHTFAVPPEGLKHRMDLQIDSHSCPLITFRRSDCIQIPIKKSFSRISLDPLVSATLQPIEVRPGVSIATITGSLEGKDNKFCLRPLNRSELKELRHWSPGHDFLPPANYSTGSLDLQLFMSTLPKAGIYDAALEHTPTGSVIHLNRKGSEEALITVDENTTHIVCDVHSPLRHLLRDLVAKCLKTY